MQEKFFNFITLSILTLSFSTGCSMLQKKINPAEEYSTETGFLFRFPMSGEWYPGSPQPGLYIAGKKPASDGSSVLAVVKHGPIETGGGKSMTNKEILNHFKSDIESESKGGRASEIKSHFSQKKYSGADCLEFAQSGKDNTTTGAMNMNNDGMICLHPNRPYIFIWMAISERWPLGKTGSSSFDTDKKGFLNSLRFKN